MYKKPFVGIFYQGLLQQPKLNGAFVTGHQLGINTETMQKCGMVLSMKQIHNLLPSSRFTTIPISSSIIQRIPNIPTSQGVTTSLKKRILDDSQNLTGVLKSLPPITNTTFVESMQKELYSDLLKFTLRGVAGVGTFKNLANSSALQPTISNPLIILAVLGYSYLIQQKVKSQ